MEMSQIRIGENGQISFTFTQSVATCKRIKVHEHCIFFCCYSLIQKESPLLLGHEWQKLSKSKSPSLYLAKTLNTDRKELTATSSCK